MSEPFTEQTPRRATVWQRLLGREPRENAVIEANNLFARAVAVRDVAPEEIDWICQRFGIDLRRELSGRAERLYREYLIYCLKDHHLSEEEHADLRHLQRVLRLDPQSVAAIHENVARQVYSRSLAGVLEDGRIDAAERAFLDRLQRDLAIPDRAVQRIVDAHRKGQEGG